jgi:CheY-like chemotaxis protein
MPGRSLDGVGRRALDGVRVLLVEDTDDARELLVFVLEQCAAVVTAAANATDGFEAFLRDRPQIVVTDLAMPGSTGAGCCARCGPTRRPPTCRRPL